MAAALGVGVLILNALFWHSPFLGLPAALFCFALATLGVAGHFTESAGAALRPRALLFGAIAIACGFTILGTAVYYAIGLPLPAIIGLLILSFTPAAVWFRKNKNLQITGWPKFSLTGREAALGTIFLATLAGAVATLAANSLTEAVRSPWEVLSPRFLVFLALATFALFALALAEKNRALAGLGAIALLAVGLSVAATVYPLGYGFDPFIHEAAMRAIAEHGVVLPKTPYYIGAYADLVSFVRLTGFDLHLLNRFAGPLFATAALGAAAALAGIFPLSIFLLALAPLSHFILTTPQGLADALALLAAALAVAGVRRSRGLALAVALAATAIHPLAGVPATLAVLLVFAFETKNRARKIGGAILIFLGLLAFPLLAFYFQSRLTPSFALTDAGARLLEFFKAALPLPAVWTFSPERSLLYAARLVAPLALLALAGFSAGKKNAPPAKRALALAALGVGLGGALMAALLKFPGMINYEQFIFPARFISLAAILLLPLAADSGSRLIRALAKNSTARLSTGVALAVIFAAAVYLAYPRVDPEDRTGGRNVSAATVAAVDWLRQNANGSYVVLGNQTAAAAEIQRYGFSRYVKGEFYFSHPSGSFALYQYYLKAVNEAPTRALMREAATAYEVDKIYFVLNDWWRDAPKIAAAARREADATYEIAGGQVLIFEYKK